VAGKCHEEESQRKAMSSGNEEKNKIRSLQSGICMDFVKYARRWQIMIKRGSKRQK
jgi:hypothetical protein